MHKVLILDAHQRSALAATRSLGKKGISVITADETEHTLAGYSKYCTGKFTYPSPYVAPDDFVNTVKRACTQHGVTVMFPMSDITMHVILKHRAELEGIHIPCTTFGTFDSLADKCRLVDLAKRTGVPTPLTYCVRSKGDLEALYSDLTFPVVLKPCRSVAYVDGRLVGASVCYARSVSEVRERMQQSKVLCGQPFLVQEFIPGIGQGIFALYDQGRPVVFFAHRRLREKPPSGGVSVLCESVEVDSRLREMAERILGSVHWHGVAMVEFKISYDGAPYLMEVNGRFWGSLQLAVDAGVDFPWLLYRLAIGERLEEAYGYKCGVRCRWLLGDLDHLYLVFKNRSWPNGGSSSKWKAVLEFLRFFDGSTVYEVNRLDDPKPFLLELKRYVRA
ncbi:MAG: ATP-grasp domain-containing protein [Nitrososphaerales archaeon]